MRNSSISQIFLTSKTPNFFFSHPRIEAKGLDIAPAASGDGATRQSAPRRGAQRKGDDGAAEEGNAASLGRRATKGISVGSGWQVGKPRGVAGRWRGLRELRAGATGRIIEVVGAARGTVEDRLGAGPLLARPHRAPHHVAAAAAVRGGDAMHIRDEGNVAVNGWGLLLPSKYEYARSWANVWTITSDAEVGDKSCGYCDSDESNNAAPCSRAPHMIPEQWYV